MKNVYGNAITVTLFGESHGKSIGAVIDGLAPGIKIDRDFIEKKLSKRRPKVEISTGRVEKDEFSIESGVYNGFTTGTPLAIIIPNNDKKSEAYEENYGKARPSHADFPAYCKFHGFEDPRGGGHFSGRITAALVAAGAIFENALLDKNIQIAAHILRIGRESERHFDFVNPDNDIIALKNADFPVIEAVSEKKFKKEILSAKGGNDSVGGILETAVIGLPAGVGEPWFDSVEGMLSHGLFSVPAVKGVEFGTGFEFSEMTGSNAIDKYIINNGKITTLTNNNGGICGGITSGMPIIFSCAIKPTPSIGKIQQTVDFLKKENTEICIEGRHDPCIVPRAAAVVEAITAITLADLLVQRFGTDYLAAPERDDK